MEDSKVLTELRMVFDETARVANNNIVITNHFMQQILNLTNNVIKKGKVVEFVLKGGVNNRGAIKNKVPWEEKAVMDACKLAPLTRGAKEIGCKTLLEEIAVYRGAKYSFSVNEARSNKFTLLVDYLLSVSLCYIEVFSGSKVDKYYATRNLNIAKAICGDDGKLGKYQSYLQMSSIDVKNKLIKAVKLTGKGNGYKITQPRSGVRVDDNLRITPVCITQIVWDKLKKLLTDNMIEFSYIKDNKTIRTITSTLNKGKLMEIYKDEEHVNRIFSEVGEQLSRGFVRVPDLELSKYDETGVRALNITRIIDMKKVDKVDTSYVDVDFDAILNTFIGTCDKYGTDYNMLGEIYKGVFKKEPVSKDCNEVRSELQSWARTQYTLATTTFLKQLHNFMLSMPLVFMGYNGKAQEFSSTVSSFNLGTE